MLYDVQRTESPYECCDVNWYSNWVNWYKQSIKQYEISLKLKIDPFQPVCTVHITVTEKICNLKKAHSSLCSP